MIADTLGMETANVIKDLHKDGIESYVLLMRHSARVIDTAENDGAMELTEEGKQAAYEFGKALPPNALSRFYSSSIHRCVETSNLIEKGYLLEGEKTETNTVMDPLYAFFAKDVLKVDKIAYAMMNEGEWAQFFRNWFDGEYSPDLLDAAPQAAQTLLTALLDLLQAPMAVGNICIAHDWHLFLIKEYYLNLRPEDNEFIQFLEGVVIYRRGGSYYMVNHQTEAKMLPDL